MVQFGQLIPSSVDQCLVVKIPMDNMSEEAKHTNDPRSLQIKATSSREVIHASMPNKLGGNWACGRELCPSCSRI